MATGGKGGVKTQQVVAFCIECNSEQQVHYVQYVGGRNFWQWECKAKGHPVKR